MISKSCKYAMRAVVYVASKAKEEGRLKVKQIAKEIDAPEAFTAKLLQTLSKHQIISSLKGPYGGFYIEPHQLENPIIRIVQAIDGLQIFHTCALGLKQCSDKRPCPFHNEYKVIREKMMATFDTITVKKLVKNMEAQTFFLNNK